MISDLTGHKSGKLTVICRQGSRHGESLWLCKCECGNEKLVTAYSLRTRKTKSCGCLRIEVVRKICEVDITGRRYGRLVAMERMTYKENNSYVWKCKCDCGNEFLVPRSRLTTKNTQSCGCMYRKVGGASVKTHKLHREFCILRQMIRRCTNPKSHAYASYGGRGIRVCKRWMQSFDNFISDMGPRPSRKHSIERVDNNGNYNPKNCRWALSLEQQQNTRYNKNITYEGRTMCIAAWARELGMNVRTLTARLRHKKWSVKAAFENPIFDPYKKGPRQERIR